MKAKEARGLYYEKYIVFEQEVRKLARRSIDLYKTGNKSLNKIIKDLASINEYKQKNINIKLLIKHKNIRNWLAHMNSNSTLPNNYLDFMEGIDDFLKKIKSW